MNVFWTRFAVFAALMGIVTACLYIFVDHVAALAVRGVGPCFVAHLLLLEEFASENTQMLTETRNTVCAKE